MSGLRNFAAPFSGLPNPINVIGNLWRPIADMLRRRETGITLEQFEQSFNERYGAGGAKIDTRDLARNWDVRRGVTPVAYESFAGSLPASGVHEDAAVHPVAVIPNASRIEVAADHSFVAVRPRRGPTPA